MLPYCYAKLSHWINRYLPPWRYCKLCGIPGYGLICQHCINEIELLEASSCKRCLATLKHSEQMCYNCNDGNWYCDKIFSKFKYTTPLDKMLHALKYHKDKSYVASLGYLLYQTLPQDTLYDAIIPIPLHKVRLTQRGFNQSTLMLKRAAMQAHAAKNWLPVHTSLVIRNVDTPRQALTNNSAERKRNLAGAFKLNKTVDFTGAKILLVDDVITTGATINSLAKLLKEHGAHTVDACCLMRAAK